VDVQELWALTNDSPNPFFVVSLPSPHQYLAVFCLPAMTTGNARFVSPDPSRPALLVYVV
jgi:hypothetical protein